MILGIYGAGGNGKTVVDLVRIINSAKKEWDEMIFVDDVTNEKTVYGLKVYTFDEAINKYGPDEIRFVISLGEPADRKMLFEKIKDSGYSLGKLVYPNAWIPEGTVVGEGVIIGMVSVGSDAIIGANTFVSQNVIIGHDTVVGSDSVISAGSFIAGHCKIGNRVYIGPKAVLRDRIDVEDTAVVAIGAVVFKSVPGNVIAMGNPARFIKKEEGYRIF